jgi:hypothetical protein
MRRSGFRAWKVFGGLALALLGVGCGYLPVSGGDEPGAPARTFIGSRKQHSHVSADRGYNGTIQQLGSSIDPRTPEREGMRNNSRRVDVTGRPAPSTPLSAGGSGDLGQQARGSDDSGPAPAHGPAGQGMMH